MYFGMTYF